MTAAWTDPAAATWTDGGVNSATKAGMETYIRDNTEFMRLAAAVSSIMTTADYTFTTSYVAIANLSALTPAPAGDYLVRFTGLIDVDNGSETNAAAIISVYDGTTDHPAAYVETETSPQDGPVAVAGCVLLAGHPASTAISIRAKTNVTAGSTETIKALYQTPTFLDAAWRFSVHYRPADASENVGAFTTPQSWPANLLSAQVHKEAQFRDNYHWIRRADQQVAKPASDTTLAGTVTTAATITAVYVGTHWIDFQAIVEIDDSVSAVEAVIGIKHNSTTYYTNAVEAEFAVAGSIHFVSGSIVLTGVAASDTISLVGIDNGAGTAKILQNDPTFSEAVTQITAMLYRGDAATVAQTYTAPRDWTSGEVVQRPDLEEMRDNVLFLNRNDPSRDDSLSNTTISAETAMATHTAIHTGVYLASFCGTVKLDETSNAVDVQCYVKNSTTAVVHGWQYLEAENSPAAKATHHPFNVVCRVTATAGDSIICTAEKTGSGTASILTADPWSNGHAIGRFSVCFIGPSS